MFFDVLLIFNGGVQPVETFHYVFTDKEGVVGHTAVEKLSHAVLGEMDSWGLMDRQVAFGAPPTFLYDPEGQTVGKFVPKPSWRKGDLVAQRTKTVYENLPAPVGKSDGRGDGSPAAHGRGRRGRRWIGRISCIARRAALAFGEISRGIYVFLHRFREKSPRGVYGHRLN
jgi:hypothetical protein